MEEEETPASLGAQPLGPIVLIFCEGLTKFSLELEVCHRPPWKSSLFQNTKVVNIHIHNRSVQKKPKKPYATTCANEFDKNKIPSVGLPHLPPA
jgi:hypothetical protein